ncbi:HTH_Tnp_Tc3_2 domain-containing protein [Trichonephila clavipes]|nr:HTH_Tnp_Tc3_2 domain-containing protein [Trichonephila clavipes]
MDKRKLARQEKLRDRKETWHEGDGTSVSNICHLHEDQAHDALDRPVVENDLHIVRNARLQPTISLAVIQAHVDPSLGAPVSSRTIRRRVAERHMDSWRPLHVLSLTLIHRHLRLKWCRARGNGMQRNGIMSSFLLSSNTYSISAVMTIVFVY